MRSFHTRIGKLEKAIVKPWSCAQCGAGELIPRQIIGLSKGGSLGKCGSCGGLIDEDGWPVKSPCITVTVGDRGFTRAPN